MWRRMVWSVGTVPQVAVPIVVPAPSSGMLLLLPPGRRNEKLREPLLKIQGDPSAPVASASTAVGCAAEVGYTQYLTRPGTPLTGFSSVSEMNVYVVMLPLFEKVA